MVVLGVGALFIVVVLVIVFMGTNRGLKSYIMEVKIVAVKSDDSTINHMIKYTTDGKKGKAVLSYKDMPIYLIEDDLIYKEKGRFKKIKTDKNYGDVYDILSSIPLKNEIKKEEGRTTYNPIVEKSILDDLNGALKLGMDSLENTNALLIKEDRTIKEFNLTFGGVEDYKSINIAISFIEKKNIEIDSINIYDELTDEVSVNELKVFISNENDRKQV